MAEKEIIATEERICDSCDKTLPADLGCPVIGGGWMCHPCDDLRYEAMYEEYEETHA